MSRRRLVPLVLGMVGLLAVVAIAARGRPLSSHGSGSGGLPQTFWDFAFTTLLIVIVLTAAVGAYALVLMRRDPEKPKPYGSRTARALAIMLAVALIVFLIGRHVNLFHLLHPGQKTPHNPLKENFGHAPKGRIPAPGSHSAHIQWTEILLVLGALLLVAAAAYATRYRPKGIRWGQAAAAPEALAAALDESLDDLMAEPDLRRAIIAAYARMERALARAGVPRHPAEAPLEYLERALLALDTSADAVRRLTDLFEWARFSHHEPEAPMRDEAIAALVAVRDELRASQLVAA